MRTIVIAALLFGVADAFGAEGATWAVVTTNSYHDKQERGYNERNTGVGFEHDFSAQWKVQGGNYKNSFNRNTIYAGVTYLPWSWNSFRFGLAAQLVTGYEERPVPVILPMIEWEGEKFGANLMVLPSVVGLQLKWRMQ